MQVNFLIAYQAHRTANAIEKRLNAIFLRCDHFQWRWNMKIPIEFVTASPFIQTGTVFYRFMRFQCIVADCKWPMLNQALLPLYVFGWRTNGKGALNWFLSDWSKRLFFTAIFFICDYDRLIVSLLQLPHICLKLKKIASDLGFYLFCDINIQESQLLKMTLTVDEYAVYTDTFVQCAALVMSSLYFRLEIVGSVWGMQKRCNRFHWIANTTFHSMHVSIFDAIWVSTLACTLQTWNIVICDTLRFIQFAPAHMNFHHSLHTVCFVLF